MRRSLLLVLPALGACIEHAPAWYALTLDEPAAASSTSSTGAPEFPPATTTTGESPEPETTSGDVEPDHAGTTDDASTTGDASATSGGGGAPVQPHIISVDMPGKVSLAGPVAFTVWAEDAALVRARLDGVELPHLEHDGGVLFSGQVPIFGAVDNGAHTLEVIAVNGQLSDLHAVPFEVATPAPGTLAWAVIHAAGSTTQKVALAPDGGVIEVGALDIDGAPRPAIRKRSPVDGAEMWAEGTIVLDEREGIVDDVAVLPDGRMWVAMNVREPSKVWRPRIVLLDALGHELGVELLGEPGATVRGIDSDDTGGFFAAGFASSGEGDMDIAVWRMNGEHVPVFSAKPWDYVPVKSFPHDFSDLAFAVVVQDDVAWVAGASQGKHEIDAVDTRGVIVRMNVETGAPLDPVIVQPTINAWRRGMYLAAAAHPNGIVVTGNAAVTDGTAQRIEISVFDASGKRTVHHKEPASPVAFGNAVVLSAHGVFVVAGATQEGDVLRGVVLGRGDPLTFDHLFPPNAQPSTATGLALDPYDQAFVGGYATFGGVTHARLARVAQ